MSFSGFDRIFVVFSPGLCAFLRRPGFVFSAGGFVMSYFCTARLSFTVVAAMLEAAPSAFTSTGRV